MADPNSAPTAQSRLTLDPADWNAFRELAHRMVDDSLEHLRTLSDRAPWQPIPPATRAALTSEPRCSGC